MLAGPQDGWTMGMARTQRQEVKGGAAGAEAKRCVQITDGTSRA